MVKGSTISPSIQSYSTEWQLISHSMLNIYSTANIGNSKNITYNAER